MAVTEGKKKNPLTFHYLPKSRAKQRKKSWVDDRKIRSKWKAQKKREGLTNRTSVPVEDAPNHVHSEINADSQPAASSHESSIPSPSHDNLKSLRELRKIAYASKPFRAQKSESLHHKKVKGYPHDDCGRKSTVTSQPNMKLRMDVLLEKIKRDFTE